MSPQRVAVVDVMILLVWPVAPAVAAGPSDEIDGFQNADRGPSGDTGPPGAVSGFVGGVVGFPDDLFASLPVPNFVKGFFGASTC